MKSLLKISLILLLLSFAPKAEAFSCVGAVGGGNWNSAASWTTCNSTFPQAGDDVTLTAVSGNIAVNVATNSLNSFDMTGYLGTLSGSSNINVVGVTASTQTIIFSSTMTVTWTGTLAVSPTTATANINLTSAGQLMTNITTAGSAATLQLQDNLSFTAAKTDALTIGTTGAIIDMNGKTISGNSTINRLFVVSGTYATQISGKLTRNSGTFANVDFRDIDLEASYNCSAITGLCGDAGNNSADFTFTTGTTQHFVTAAGGAWSTVSNWTSRIPLPQDNVVMDVAFNSGITVTSDMQRLGKDIDWTGMTFTGTKPTWNNGSATVGGINIIFGSLTLQNSTNMSLTSSGNTLSFGGRGGAYTLTSAGQTLPIQTVSIAVAGGTLTLQDALIVDRGSTLGGISFSDGTFNTNGMSVTINFLTSTGSRTRTLTLGGTTWVGFASDSLNGPWNIVSTGMTLNSNSSTIIIANSGTGAKTFAGSGFTYNNLTITGQNVVISGSNTFNGTLALSTAGRLYSLPTSFTQSTTQTVANFTVNSTSTVDLVLASSTTATNATLAKSGGSTICLDFVRFQDLTGSPVSTWYAGANSVDSGGTNVNITFTACPVATATPSTYRMIIPAEYKLDAPKEYKLVQ